MSNGKLKLITPNGNVVDLLVEVNENVDLLEEVIAIEEKAVALGYTSFALAPQPTGPAPGNGASPAYEAEVPTTEGKPGQLAKRFQSAILEVSPRSDGKCQIAFYGDDIKPPKNDFPYVTNVYQPATWVKMFGNVAPFQLEDFQKAGQLAVRADVEVRFGKNKTDRGNYYRDITAITPAPGVGEQAVETYVEQEVAPSAAVEAPEDIPF